LLPAAAVPPEQRRVQAGSTIVLPCYALAGDTTNNGPVRQRRQRTTWSESRDPGDDDVTRPQFLRHSRRASRPRAREADGGWLYEWIRDDDPIDPPAVSSKFSVDALDHSLTIRNVSSASDTALYTCLRHRRSHDNLANSSAAVITSQQIQLVVEGTHDSSSE